MICHGQGDSDLVLPGCCYLPGGVVCPWRWTIDAAGNVVETGTSLDTAIRTQFGVNNPNMRNEIKQFIGRSDGVGPVMFICTVAGQMARTYWDEFIDPQGNLSDAAQLDLRWSEQYAVGALAEDVGDAWEAAGMPRNWCVTFGPGEGHCCFREDQATNDAKAASVTVTRVSVSGRSTMGG